GGSAGATAEGAGAGWSRSQRQGRAEEDEPSQQLSDQHGQDGDVEQAGRRHRLRDLQAAVDQVGDAERGERSEHDAQGEQRGVLMPKTGDGRGPVARRQPEHQQREQPQREVNQQDGDEVAEDAPQRLDREAEVDQIPMTEEHAACYRSEHEGAGQEGDGVDQGGRTSPRTESKAERAHREREEAEEDAGGEAPGAERVRIAPQRGEIGAEGSREGCPEGQLADIAARERAGPEHQGHLASEEQQGEAQKDPRARTVEAAVEDGEGRDREPNEASYRQLPEEQEEAVAEARHGAEV